MKHGILFTDQSKHSKSKTELRDDDTETQDARNENQSQANRTFEIKNSVNEIEQGKPTTSGQSDISTSKSSHILLQQNPNEKMDRENFYHWGTPVRLWISSDPENSPETRKLIEQRNALSRPGALRRRYDHRTQRTVFAPYRLNKRSREEIAEINVDIMRRANKLGGGYQQIQEEPEENPEEGDINQEPEDTEEDSVVLRGDN